MKKLPLLLLFISTLSLAQYTETIATDRPGQAIGANSLGAKVFQIQSGVAYNAIEEDGFKLATTAFASVFRYGLLERLDLNAAFVWQNDVLSGPSISSSITGVSNTEVGLRYSITDNKGWVPAIGIQGKLLLKLQDKEYQRMDLGTNFVVATNNTLIKSLSLTTNWGMLHTGNVGDAQFSYVVNLGYGISDKVGVFIETYGGLNDFTANFDTGLSYLINKDLLIDLSTGWQGQDGVSNWFVDAGLSWRFDWRDPVK